ncbi:MAG: YigZ family protein [candidate division Zixibacteria bacterium]
MSGKPNEDQYLQLKKRYRLEDKIKGSRFIGTAAPAETIEEAAKFIDEIKKEFHDATHNCWAWKVGIGKNQKYRYNDNGEPSGTAGQPILKAIDSTRISNVCVVVTRYFGGVKLGTGGLMRAYGQTAQSLLRSGTAVKKFAVKSVAFKIGFDFVNVIHLIIKNFSAETEDSHYGEQITFKVNVRASKLTNFKNKLVEATNGQIEFE